MIDSRQSWDTPQMMKADSATPVLNRPGRIRVLSDSFEVVEKSELILFSVLLEGQPGVIFDTATVPTSIVQRGGFDNYPEVDYQPYLLEGGALLDDPQQIWGIPDGPLATFAILLEGGGEMQVHAQRYRIDGDAVYFSVSFTRSGGVEAHDIAAVTTNLLARDPSGALCVSHGDQHDSGIGGSGMSIS
ncbi:hypothetical protein [Prescottella sp. R16]|uniref:hypothetical protein n=1 Tax=Prescottella sp. R16 TaxID=3064529 RepID=UPI00272E4DE1|nr:hypothetical protein [Prescottella sp. R16]